MMLEIMDTINSEHKHGVILGDMNVDLVKYNDHQSTGEYLDTMFSRGFLPAITRVTNLG